MRDIGLLDAAAHRPRVVLYGEEAPRVSVVFCGLDDTTLDAPDDDANELARALAGSGPSAEDVAAALGTWH